MLKHLYQFFTHSVRGQFLGTALVLGISVTAITVISQIRNNELVHTTSNNMTTRNQLLEQSRLIRNTVWHARESLASFLLDPYKNEYVAANEAALQEALNRIDILSTQEWIVQNDKTPLANQLRNTVGELRNAIRELISTRLNAASQYPSLYYSGNTLFPIAQEFETAAALAMDEVEAANINSSSFQIYRRFASTRSLWIQMISNYRMYLANRMGSFDSNTLRNQERDVELIYSEVTKRLKEILALDKQGKLDFQASASIQQMIQSAEEWHKGFDKVKEIHSSDEWRADARLLKTQIAPLINRTWENLIEIDHAIEQSANDDVIATRDLTSFHSVLLWTLTIAGLITIGIIFILLDNLLLKPLDAIAKALKLEANGAPIPDLPASKSVEMQYLLDAFAEMRQQIQQRQTALEHQATHDTLTGLPNRSLLADRFKHAINKGSRYKKSMSFIMMDLDRFKEVNDTLGHQVGDRLLQALATRLNQVLRKVDTVARLGGDEFGILLEETSAEQAAIVAQKIIKSFEKPVEIDSHTLYLAGSIGIATYPEHGDTHEILMQHADVAMYVAKQNRLGYSVYDANIDKHTVGRLALMTDLRKAIAHDTLNLHFQPKLNIATGELVGVEALLRWTHPELGMIPPDQVIPVAEHTGLIKPLTLWVLEKALRQGKIWQKQGLEFAISVNVSAYNLQDEEFEHEVKSRLAYIDYPPQLLTIEVTESAMMSNPAKAAETLHALDKLGVHISIDDFGTGFSSLSYLKQLPVDELKIDKMFVMSMHNSENEHVIVKSTIELAHNLGLQVVAEGIENRESWDMLKAFGCDIGQGYFLSKPLAINDFEAWRKSDYYQTFRVNSTSSKISRVK